jgi:hypothetical protein
VANQEQRFWRKYFKALSAVLPSPPLLLLVISLLLLLLLKDGVLTTVIAFFVTVSYVETTRP